MEGVVFLCCQKNRLNFEVGRGEEGGAISKETWWMKEGSAETRVWRRSFVESLEKGILFSESFIPAFELKVDDNKYIYRYTPRDTVVLWLRCFRFHYSGSSQLQQQILLLVV